MSGIKKDFAVILRRFFLLWEIDLKNLLQMFTIHNNIQVAYQCCSTTVRIILKYRSTSEHHLDDLIEHLNTALAVLLTEVIQINNEKELQVRHKILYFFFLNKFYFIRIL